jgi:hypothetical protein
MPALLIYNLNDVILDDGGNMTAPIRAFGLPTFADGIRMTECSVATGVCYAYAGSQSSMGAFYDNIEDPLVMVSLSNADTLTRYHLVFLASVLLSYSAPGQGDFIPWEVWGPAHSHLMLAPGTSAGSINRSDLSIFGSRRVMPQPLRRPDGTLVVQLCDYHPRRVAFAAALRSPDPTNWQVLMGGSVDGPWNTDGSPLETSLPYILTERPLPDSLQSFDPNEILMCLYEDGLVAYTVRCDALDATVIADPEIRDNHLQDRKKCVLWRFSWFVCLE